MASLSHRDMTPEERARVERAVQEERGVEPGWSSLTVAAAILLSGSFVAGVVFFGLPVAMLVVDSAPSVVRDRALFLPGVATMLVGGSWSIVYYARGAWRVPRELREDLEYGRVEVLQGLARDAWVVDGVGGTTWVLDLSDEVLILAPSACPAASPRTFPGRRLRIVRCKHSGLVLDLAADGPALAPSGRLRGGVAGSLESRRCEGPLEEASRGVVAAA